MINYFKELLTTLKAINSNLTEINKSTKRLAECVRKNHHGHGDQSSLSTKHWNQNQ